MDNFRNVFDGLMLGDGSLRSRSKISAQYRQDCIHKNFLFIVKEHFISNEIYVQNIYPKFVEILNKKTNKIYKKFVLESFNDKKLLLEYKRWYPEGKKIVPKDLILTPLTIKYWYYGDGSLCIREKRPGSKPYIQLSTDSFSLEDRKFLLDCFLEKKIIGSTSKNKKIYINVKTTPLFFEYIGECDLLCFKYKWQCQDKKLYRKYKSYADKRLCCCPVGGRFL